MCHPYRGSSHGIASQTTAHAVGYPLTTLRGWSSDTPCSTSARLCHTVTYVSCANMVHQDAPYKEGRRP